MFLSKYGVARHIYIAIPKAGSANHAVGADWTPAAGDVKISKDGGAAANVTNLPTAIAMGNSASWDFSLTATEMQAAQISVHVSDSATKAVDDTGFIIETYGNASAQHAVDLSDSVRAGLTALPNAAAGANGGLPLGDASGRVDLGKWLGTAVTLTSSLPDVNTKTIAAGIIAAATFAANALDAVWSAATRLLTAGTNIVLAKGTGVTGFNDLDAAGVRSAVGLASANLDTQLTAIDDFLDTEIAAIKAKTDNLPAAPAAVGDIPSAATVASAVRTELTTELGRVDATVSSRATQASVDDLPTNAELATALGTADDAVLTAIGALSIPSAATTAAAVRTNLEGSTPIPVNVKQVNDVDLLGDGSATPWGPV